MNRSLAVATLVLIVALSVAAATALRRDTGSSTLPTAVVTTGEFVDVVVFHNSADICPPSP